MNTLFNPATIYTFIYNHTINIHDKSTTLIY